MPTTDVVRKRFWADGTWLSAFFLVPFFLGLAFFDVILIFGTYAALRTGSAGLKAVLLFSVFIVLISIAAIMAFRSVFASFFERMEFTPDRIIYRGFGAYVLPYQNITRVTLKERRGVFGRERFLFFAASDGSGGERFYLIPRWRALTGGFLSRILGERMKISIIDRGLLSFYAAFPGKDWIMYCGLAAIAALFIFSFVSARSAPEAFSGIAIFLWILLLATIIALLARYFQRKREVVI